MGRLTEFAIRAGLRIRGLNSEERDAAMRLRTFALHQLGIELHIGQLTFAGHVLLRRPGSQLAKYLTLVLTSGNRAGKTSILAILILYSCLQKLGADLPGPGASDKEVKHWGEREYHWYHFGIAHEVADLVYNDIIRMLAGTHDGQADGCPMTRGGPIEDHDVKEYGDFHHIRFRPEVGGAQIHFRTTGEKSLGQLGKSMHGLSFDEPGVERNLEFLIDEVFDFRRLDTGGQLLMASTPSEEMNTAFPDVWARGDPENPERLSNWLSMRMSTLDNIGYGLTEERFDALFGELERGSRKWRQNIEGEFLDSKTAYFNAENVEATFRNRLPERMNVRPRTVYLQGVDPAKSQDSAWSIVLMIIPNPVDPERWHVFGVRAEQKKGQKSTTVLVALAADAYRAYERTSIGSHCYTAIDATGFGGKMFREALDEDIPNLFNVEFGGTIQKKRKLLGDLRTLIDQGRLHLPRTGIWKSVRKQLLGYKLEDRGIEQDAVMALVCAVYLLRRAPADGESAIPFDLS